MPAGSEPTRRSCAAGRTAAAGFTLVELLVVIAIIAVLAGVLLPSLSGARRVARSAACLANVRSLETAHVGYMGDYKEFFIDAAMAHGGLGDPARSWPVVLSRYTSEAMALRSPADRSRFWAVAEGGTFAGLTLREYLELATDGDRTNDPPPATLARWTSYGLNNYTTRSAAPPRELMARPRYDAWSRVPRPHATVHFLMMTPGSTPDSVAFARSDHVHAEGWDNGPPGSAPRVASREMDVSAWGGSPRDFSAVATYGFLDGHAATLRFADVYTDFNRNRFYPEVAP